MAASRILLVLLSISLLALTSAQRDNEDDEISSQEQGDLEGGDSNQQLGDIHAGLNEKKHFQDQLNEHGKMAIKSKKGKNGQRGRRSSGGDSLDGQDRQGGSQPGRGGQGGRGRSAQKGQNGQRGKGGQRTQRGRGGQRNQNGQYHSSPNDQSKGESYKDGLQ
ncbi:nacrein-like protein P1 [Apodemus sylvaticus]|uniref:nacrein-like protein P1 n=1 Tax=Apodemus sylvaticus TaxID=10129 RepID=UPI0022439765|nr:nacrein-like protein P1 [Apodemus sylvaticus]